MNHKLLLKQTSFAIIFLLFGSFKGFAQDNERLFRTENDTSINYYTNLSFGLAKPLYRDFATSPLFYKGVGINLNSARLKRSDLRERIFDVGLGFNLMSAKVPKSDYIQSGASAMFGHLDFYYHELWKIKKLSNSDYNLKVGGAVIVSQNFRFNQSLENNAVGLENISNLMASAQLTRDVSRRKTKKLNLFLFKPTLKPVKRDLRLLVNVGVLNFNFRPGYAYSYDSEMIGTETNPIEWAFSNYKWSLNGWRAQTQLEFTTYLPNGNARSISYIWEAANAPGKHEAFQMASHRIQFAIHFHTKKR
jgi:hypothetical protein